MLWNGADVEWVGPNTTLQGMVLRPGFRTVVVDAGRHHLRSVSHLRLVSSGDTTRQTPKGVLIQVGSRAVDVDPANLKVIASGHPLRAEPDGTPAEWWHTQLDRWGRQELSVSSFVPRSMQAVSIVMHPWNHANEPASWAEVARRAELPDSSALWDRFLNWDSRAPGVTPPASEPLEGELSRHTAAALIDVLEAHTVTPHDVFVAVWIGFGDVPPERFPGAAHIETEHREHFLLRGTLRGALESISVVRERTAGGIWWPADRSWFVHTEVDFCWTFVAGRQDLMADLDGSDALEVQRTTHDKVANRPQ